MPITGKNYRIVKERECWNRNRPKEDKMICKDSTHRQKTYFNKK